MYVGVHNGTQYDQTQEIIVRLERNTLCAPHFPSAYICNHAVCNIIKLS